MEVSQEHKNEIERQIVGIVLTELQKGKLLQEDLPLIGQFVLDNIDTIKTEEKLMKFLAELTKRWSIFSPLPIIEQAEQKEAKEDDVTSNVLQLIKKGNIDEAIGLAKTMTQGNTSQ